MSSSDIFSIVGSALEAQNARMGAIASNLANADTITPPGAHPTARMRSCSRLHPWPGKPAAMGRAASPDLGVNVVGTVQSNATLKTQYDPSSPYANAQGYVTGSNVSQADEMVDLIDSSNSYSASVAVLQQSSRIDQQMLSSFQVS